MFGYSDDSLSVVAWRWDAEMTNRLHTMTADGNYRAFQWLKAVDGTDTALSKDPACVAVIDGRDILLTSFRHVIIPPPMSQHRVTTEAFVNIVAFGPSPAQNRLVALDCDGWLNFSSELSGCSKQGPVIENKIW